MREQGFGGLRLALVAGVVFAGVNAGPVLAQDEGGPASPDKVLIDPNQIPLSTPQNRARMVPPNNRVIRVNPAQPPRPVEPRPEMQDLPMLPELPATQPADTQPAGPPPDFQFEETEYKFGRIEGGKELKHTFKAKNVGVGVLKVLNVHPTCGCTVATGWAREVPPGGTWELNVIVRTAGFNGAVTKTVIVTTNDPKKPNIELRLTGEIIARFKYESRQIFHFGRLQKDAQQTQTTRIVSQLEPLTKLIEAKVVPPDGFRAELTPREDGKSWDLAVSTVPPLKEGMNQATVEITTDSKEEPVLRLPIYVQVPPRIEVLPMSVQLPDVTTRQQIRTVTLRNNTKKPLEVTDVAVSDPAIKTELKKSQDGTLYTIVLTVPEGAKIPEQGANLTIQTTDEISPKFVVPIQVLRTRAVGRPTTPPGPTTPGGAMAPGVPMANPTTRPAAGGQ